MLPIVSGHKSPEATLANRGNSEAPQGLSFIHLLGASDSESRGTPGARNFPGEFRPIATQSPIDLAPVAQEPLSPAAQYEFSIPPQTEKVRDSQSYFYAAGMEDNSAPAKEQNAINQNSDLDSDYRSNQQEQLNASREKAAELRDLEKQKQQKAELDARQKEADLKGRDRIQEQQDRKEARIEAERQEKQAAEKEASLAAKKEKQAERSSTEKETEGKLSSSRKDSETTKETGSHTRASDAGSIAGISGQQGQKFQVSSESEKGALTEAILKQALIQNEKSGEKSEETVSSKGKEGLWDRLTSLDRNELKEIKDKIQAHPEFDKALKAMREGKDLNTFIQRIVEELDRKDLKNLKDLAQSAFRTNTEVVSGNVVGGRQVPESKWNVEGPGLSSEMRVRTDEKASTSGKGGDGQSQNQSRSDGQTLNFRMDSVAAADARSKATAENKEALPYDRKQFEKMVEQARVRLGSDGRSTAQIRMNPEHLGRMHLDLVMKDNVISGRVLVENQQAFKMIQEDIDNLRQELAKHGIQLDTLNIKTRESLQSQLQQENRQSMQFDQQDLQNGNSKEREGNSPSENPENTEKYDSTGPTLEERSIADVSEGLLVGSGAGRIDLSV
ncbi:MAG: flagellar hook-length control protein FliK [Leptospiraceae bacterium]